MNFKLLGLFKKFYLTSFSLLFIATAAEAEDITIDLNGPSSAWKAIMKGSNFDPNGDTQAGAEGVELVGDANHSVLYTLYDDQGTISNTDDSIAYRIRIGDGKDSAVYVIGIDANLDGKIDLFVNGNGKQNGRAIEFVDPGSDANISPNTTSMEKNPSFEIAYTALNYNFDSVQNIDGNSVTADIGPNGKLDHFISFEFPFVDVQTQMANVAGLNIDENTVMQYILVSLTQNSSINGDVGGIDDKVADWDVSYADLGMLSPPVSFSNLAPVITNNSSANTASLFINENLTAVVDIDATDAENDSITYSISGGADAALFSIDDSSGELTFKVAPDFETPSSSLSSNAYVVQVSASDGSLSDSQTITINIDDVNEGGGNVAPTISGTPDTNIAQGSDYSFTPTASDPDGDDLSFSVTGLPSWALFDDTTGEISGTPDNDDVGTYNSIIITVTSAGPLSNSLPAFAIEVTNVNDAPTISGTPATSVAQDGDYSFIPDAIDIDGDDLSFSVTGLPSWALFDDTTGEISGTPSNDDVGSYSDIVITVTSAGPLSNSLPAFAIEVTNVNDAPTISGTPATSVTQGGDYSFTPGAIDIDGDDLSFSVTGLPSWALFDDTTGEISGTPSNDDVGSYSNIVITVTSAGPLSNSLPAFSITVMNANDAPTISGTPATTVAQDADYSFTPDANDLDGDALSFSVTGLPSWALFDDTTGEISGTPDNADVGIYNNIVITVTSAGPLSNSLPAFSIEVTNVNDAPTISGTPATSVAQDGDYSFTPIAADIDGDDLSFSVTGLPSWALFDSTTGKISGTPDNDDVGSYNNIVITVNSAGPLSNSLPAFNIEVTNVNDAPTISGTPATTVAQDGDYSFTPDAIDLDGDDLSFSVTGLPSWALFDSTTGKISGTPDNDDVGSYNNIVITVTSAGPLSNSLPAFNIEVTNVNDAPTISGTPTTSVAQDGDYSFTPDAIDIDGDDLSFSVTGLPSWALFDSTTGKISGTPDNDDVGSYNNIVITVNSAGPLSNSLPAFNIEVTNVNDAPTISGTPATSVAQDGDYSFTPVTLDPDGDPLTFSVFGLPSWADFNYSDGSITGTPSNDDVGTYSNIVITVTSAGPLSNSLPAFAIEVTNVNDAPTISGTPVATIAQDSPYNFTPDTIDLDGDPLTFSVFGLPSWADFNYTDGSITGTPSNDDVGTYSNIVITVTSTGPLSNSLPAFSIEVTNVNDAPTITGTPATSVAENSPYSFTPDANDIDDDSLIFSIINKPSWADFDTSTGALTGTPGASDAGNYENIQISVADGGVPVFLSDFSISVTDTNQRPSADNQVIEVVENIAQQITLSGLDDDLDDLIFNIVTDPINGLISGNSPTFTYTPNTNFIGSDSFSFSANDGNDDSDVAIITITVLADLDKDGIPDVTDNDTDGDGIDNATEGTGDTDGDSIPDYLDEDADNDGIPDSEEGINDTDQDGTPDYLDSSIDEDNDGIPDIIEGTGDSDNDTIPDHLDTDSDNDGITDTAESSATGMDSDNDGIDDAFDVDITNGVDSNGDGIDDDIISQDSDDDGLADRIDTDSDNDGIPDVVEAHLRIVDTDNDGIPNDIDVDQTGGADDDNDGIDDNFDVTYTAGIDADNDGIDDTLKPKSDRDNDGIADYLDLDSDNDGINDTAEAGISGEDYDGDGVDDSFDVDATNGTDSNNDGIDDNATVVDTDLDGVPDLHDLDSDNDSLFDITEAGIADTDNNALIDVETALVEEPIDSDEDGIADFRDIDSDNDGINDIDTSTSATLDVDNNGVIDNTIDNDADGIDDAQDNLPNQHGTSFVENDQDNDGIPDSEEGIVDTDQDGTPNYLDEDSDNDGIPDSEEGIIDSDEDNIPDYLDEDSDNDGIPDVDEGTVDTDQDNIPDYLDEDSDNDGIPDVDEGTVDTDEDGTPDYQDQDSDNDSIPDVDEGTVDTDEDGIPDYQDQDSDNDGIPDVDEGIVDTDEDGTPDYQDQDSDNDSIPDVDEGSVDTDEDGIPNYQDEDSDNDGTPDADEGTTDTDEDGIPDYIDESDTEIIGNNTDIDSDNDGISDIDEGNEDLDNDGIPNHLDTDSDGDGILDADENGDFNNDGINDRLQASGKVETGVKGAGSTGAFITLLLMFAVMLRQSKKRILILLAMPLLLTTNAQASDECKLGQSFANIDCWYIGAGLGYATLDPKHKNTSWRIAEDNDTAVKVFAGLALSEHLFTELSYEDMGTAELHNLNPSITENLNIDYSAFGANVGFLLNERQSTWNVYAKAGVSFLDTDTGVHVEQDHGTQLTFGLGAQWNFSEKWFARIDLTAYDEDANVIGLSIARYFGSSTKASPKKKAVKKAPIRKPAPAPAPIIEKEQKVVAINPDLDGDGVLNDADKCPETVANTKVNAKGCALMASITLNIQFDSWKSNVKEQYLAEINRVAKIIDEHEDIDVVVEGHTDWQGSNEKNQVLSEARAEAVATLLEEKTPNSDKTYSTIGFGELKPIADNKTEEGRSLNRRVVVVISEK